MFPIHPKQASKSHACFFTLKTFFCLFSRIPYNFLLKAEHTSISSNRGWNKEAIYVRIYVTVTRHCTLFNVSCSCRYQKLNSSLSLFLSPLTLGFSETLHLPAFNCNPLLFYWHLVCVMVWYRRKHSIFLWLNLSLFVGLCLRAMTFTSISLVS